ncbi:MAG TPA: hypothetical protein VG055_31835 [Planctomycetaceae bacterium]|nr:hypothetical protein [Planctomycetaceae bacterium]
MSEANRGLGSGGCVGLLVTFFAGVIIGGFAGIPVGVHWCQTSLRHEMYLDERDAVASATAKDPAFKMVQIYEEPHLGILLMGKVPTAADKKRLLEIVTRQIGERRAARQTRVEAEGER